MTTVAPIRPEFLATKFAKIDNFEEPDLLIELGGRPELRSVFCYLQHVSQPRNYPGGLGKFAADLIAASSDFIGTAHMHKARQRDRYTLAEATTIFSELTEWARSELFGINCELFEDAFLSGLHERTDGVGETRRDWIPLFLNGLTPERARAVCTQAAQSELAEYLKETCELPHIGLLPVEGERSQANGAPWYFARIADGLVAFIEKRASGQHAAIAQTAITKLIETWTGKSRRMGTTVMIVGNSRFGKTETVQLEAATRPGHCRVVQTPPGNALSDLLREVAKALGIEVGPQTNGRALAELIDYILRHLKLQLIFDEAQFLLPANYSRNTAPARLNWFRRTIMDQQIPSVLVCTPQSYLPAKRRFEKATGFAMEQFEERIDKTVTLPAELDEADLLAVARVHFPDLSGDYLQYVVSKTLATERNYISDISKIARHAKDHAQENGRKRPILADINSAMADVLPTVPAPSLQPVKTRKAAAVQRPCRRSAEPLQSASTTFETEPRFARQSLTVASMT